MSRLKSIVFVVGASRSGTTMLARILGRNEEVYTLNEMHYFGDLFDFRDKSSLLTGGKLLKTTAKLVARYRRGIWNDRVRDEDLATAKKILNEKENINPIDLFRLFAEWVAHETNSSVIVEHTPRNIYYAKEILDSYPEAKILHIVRDPRAVVASQKNRWKRRKNLNAKNIPIREGMREYINYHPYTMSMLWKKAFASGMAVEGYPRCIRIKFEEVISNSSRIINPVCKFIEISYSVDMLNVSQIDSSVRQGDNKKIGIIKESLDAWKKILNEGEIFLIEKILNKDMSKMNYKFTNNNINRQFLFFIVMMILRFPIHVLGMIIINPGRLVIQVKGILHISKQGMN